MPSAVTIAQALKQASERLRAASVANDLLDAQALLGFTLRQDRTYLIVNYNQTLDEETLAQFESLVARRCAGEPLQYITGRQEFFGLEFEVTPDVLIPRPETELIIEETIRLVQQRVNAEPDWHPRLLDVGTGSGCIAVVLARELETVCDDATIVASDISSAALAVAQRNAARHGLSGRIEFRQMNLLDDLAAQPQFDFILSNPPYVAAAEMPTLQREVRDWEPPLALTDDADGLSFYRRLLNEAPARLQPGGYWICEIGYNQRDAINSLIDESVWSDSYFLDDLQAIPRTLVCRKRS